MDKTILVVDDISINNFLVEKMFVTEKYNILTAESGAQALEMIKENHIDLVLLDLMMPQMNGYEVLNAIKKNPETKDIKVVILSALSDPLTKEKAMSMGADDILSKPIVRQRLIDTVARQLS